jgi:hypothetical protein
MSPGAAILSASPLSAAGGVVTAHEIVRLAIAQASP